MEMVNLMGNHESTMLDALAGERAAGTDWLFAGGKAALESYGIDPEGPRDLWARLIPQSHQAFLRNLILMHREGGYAFIHAGVRPGIALENQARDDLLRSRQPFLYSEREFRRRRRAWPYAGENPLSFGTTASRSTPGRCSAAR